MTRPRVMPPGISKLEELAILLVRIRARIDFDEDAARYFAEKSRSALVAEHVAFYRDAGGDCARRATLSIIPIHYFAATTACINLYHHDGRHMSTHLSIRDGNPDELAQLGSLLVKVYAALPGFPTPAEQPGYYEVLANIARFAEKPGARVLVALSERDELVGGVVYFGDMTQYGSAGIATSVKQASGIRLLGVDPAFRNTGAGKALTLACVELAREAAHSQVILHTTKAMQLAWGMYEKLGFVRSEDLDFSQGELRVYGFRLAL